MLFLSPIIQGPELTVPSRSPPGHYSFAKLTDYDASVRQVPFHSRVSGRTEHLPVAVSLLASWGNFRANDEVFAN